MSQELLSFSTIVAYLRKLCQEKRTGTLLITSNYRLLGQISIEAGEIVFLFSQGKRGINALPLFANTKDGTITFSEGKVPARTPLPPTGDILEFLTSANPAAAVANKSEPLSFRPLSPSAKTILEQTLKEFIGPIASLVCTDHFRTTATLEATINALAGEIPAPAAANQFRELARKRLG
ncbi:MAG: hypothetical protein RKP20_15940 [Candidatus Competibacter sp.]|nr:hypothetical protein [Candidatus Competibacter sp.]